MKKINSFLVLGLLCLFSPFVLADSLVGHWTLVGIKCESGKNPQIPFDPKTRYDMLFYANQTFENPVITPGTWMVFRGSYTVSFAPGFCLRATEKLEAMKPPAPHDYQHCFNTRFSNHHMMVGFVAEGNEDYCAQGDQIQFYFSRLK